MKKLPFTAEKTCLRSPTWSVPKNDKLTRMINPAASIDHPPLFWLPGDILVLHLVTSWPIYPRLKVLQDIGLSVVESRKSGQTEMDWSPTCIRPQDPIPWASLLQWPASETMHSDLEPHPLSFSLLSFCQNPEVLYSQHLTPLLKKVTTTCRITWRTRPCPQQIYVL